MSIKIQDLDSTVNDTLLISINEDANQSPATQIQKQQIRILSRVYFLFSMSIGIYLGLSVFVLNQDIGKFNDIALYSLDYLICYVTIGKSCASVIWGLASDRIGRKKALNISLIGSSLTMALFGFCRSFNSFAFIYSLFGVFSCSHIFIKTMLAEYTCKESRPKLFSSLIIKNIIAVVFGLFFSVIYSMALDKDTNSITGVPYIIPSLIASGINVAAYILSNRYLNETLTDKRDNLGEYAIADISTNQIMISTKSNQIRIFGMKFSENSLLLLTIFSLLTIILNGYSIISHDWPTMDLSKGGLNLKLEHIMVISLPLGIIKLAIFYKYTYIYKKIGALNQLKAGFLAAGVLFILSLMLTLTAKIGSNLIVLSLYAILFSVKAGIAMLASISFDLLLCESAEVSGNLGTLYGILNTLSGIIPIVLFYVFTAFSGLFAENSLPFPLNYSCTWLLAILSLTGYWLSSKIKTTV